MKWRRSLARVMLSLTLASLAAEVTGYYCNAWLSRDVGRSCTTASVCAGSFAFEWQAPKSKANAAHAAEYSLGAATLAWRGVKGWDFQFFAGTMFEIDGDETYRTVLVRAPCWAVALVAGTGTFLAWKKRPPRSAGTCPRCGYDLRATPGRCPECGAPAPSETAARP